MLKALVRYCFFVLISFGILACGGPSASKIENVQVHTNKTAEQILGDSNYLAICYGAYRQNTRDSQPSVLQIKEDLKILSAIGIKILRTYNTTYPEVYSLMQAITELRSENSSFEMYVMLGAWIDCENAWTNKTPNHERENLEANTREINNAIELANKYPDIIKIISVGNEAMVKWATRYYVTPNIILKWVNYLQKLKKEDKLNKDLWISTSDNFASWGGGDSLYHTEDLNNLYKAVDYISIHTYPMHDTHYNPVFWGINENEKQYTKIEQIDSLMIRAVEYAKNQYYKVFAYMKSIGVNKPIHIGETGWSTHCNQLYGIDGSKACDEYKSAQYYQLMRAWTNHKKIACFYFESFDEQWKDAQNTEGSENHFGLFTVEGRAKFALWNKVDEGIFDGLKRDGNVIEKTYNGNWYVMFGSVKVPIKQVNDER